MPDVTNARTQERRRLLESFTGVPATEGNRVDVLRNGGEIFPAMLDAIEAAEHTIDFMTFVYWRGEITRQFAEAFAERARAGVRVRVLLDGFGAHAMDPRQRDQMREAGVQVVEFRPLRSWRLWQLNLRTHRRVLVCDGRVGFTGGVGIAQEWVDGGHGSNTPGWRETHFRITGPAVAGIHAAFLSNWLENDHRTLGYDDPFPPHDTGGDSTVQVIRGSSQLGWNDTAIAIRALLEVAEERIRVTSAYFRPPPSFRAAMTAAVDRGVAVEVLVPGPHAEPVHYRWAGEYHYRELLDGRVDIWHYQPTMLHAKTMTVDGELALVGTTNFDARSVAINEQVGLVVHDPEVTAVLDQHFEQDLADSRRVDPTEWERRPWSRRALQLAGHALTYPIRGAGAVR